MISAFVFATWKVQSLYFLNPKFQASSHLLWLYSPVCVGPGRKPRRPVFSQRGSNNDQFCFSRILLWIVIVFYYFNINGSLAWWLSIKLSAYYQPVLILAFTHSKMYTMLNKHLPRCWHEPQKTSFLVCTFICMYQTLCLQWYTLFFFLLEKAYKLRIFFRSASEYPHYITGCSVG